MSSWTQFVCGAAVGVALFVGATKARHYLLYSRGRSQEDHTQNFPSTPRSNHLQSVQAVLTPGPNVGYFSASSEYATGFNVPEGAGDEGQNILNVLFNITEDQARKDGYIHRGITCNSCQASPVCGVRYKCANCVDFDICENCEAVDTHNKTHVFIKIRIPLPPLANPRTPCFAPLYPGKKDHPLNTSWDEIQKIKNDSHFNQVEIEALVDQFKTLATETSGITWEVFRQCLGPLGQHRNLVMEQMFKFYDQNEDNIIDVDEFVAGLSILVKGSQEEKVPYAFKGYDIDNKGFITKENLRKMFKAFFEVSLELVRDVVRACEEEMMATFDDSGDKPVSSVFNAPIPSVNGPSSSSSKPSMSYSNPGNRKKGKNGTWPVMEAMSQDAISEMVENVFQCADTNKDGQISLEEFTVWSANDSTLLAWFEALGTIF